MRARFAGTCAVCEEPIVKGQQIAGEPGAWSHETCSKVLAEYEKNRALILAGETFASRKPSGWRRGQGPGSVRNKTA